MPIQICGLAGALFPKNGSSAAILLDNVLSQPVGQEMAYKSHQLLRIKGTVGIDAVSSNAVKLISPTSRADTVDRRVDMATDWFLQSAFAANTSWLPSQA